MTKQPKKSAAALADARRRYDAGEPLAPIAASLNMGAEVFLRFRRKENWPLRLSPIRRKTDAPKTNELGTNELGTNELGADEASQDKPAPEAELVASSLLPTNTTPPNGLVDVEALRRRLERAVEAELASVEARLSGQSVAMGERNARLLASLVKTFAELRRFAAASRPKPGAGDDSVENDEPAPRDINVLRDELARLVERIAREQSAL